MSDRSTIEWTSATWNPVTGCDEVSPGCDHCYAKTFAERFRGTPGHHFERGFDVQLRPEMLERPLRWRKPRKVFVNSMSDLFHDQVPDEYIAQVFAVMAAAPQHTFQVLTKRHGRMRSLLSTLDFDLAVADAWSRLNTTAGAAAVDHTPPYPLPNVWLGVSAEDQKWAGIRIPALLETPAAVRFVSAEPLLGPIDLRTGRYAMPPDGETFGTSLDGIDWVIVGGESGRGARPMQLDWARFIRDQCQSAGVAFFYKQQGTHGGTPKSERTLDGRTWDEFPEAAA